MQQTFARKKSAGGAQDKGTRPILSFLKPLGGGAGGGQGQGEQPAAAPARAPGALQQAKPRLALPGGSKPAGKQPSLFDFADSSDNEEEAPVKPPAARPKLQPLRPLGQRTAAAAAAAAAPPKPSAAKAAAASTQASDSGALSGSSSDDSDGSLPAAAARAVAAAAAGTAAGSGGKPHKRQRAAAAAARDYSLESASEEEDGHPEQLADDSEGESSDSEEEGESSDSEEQGESEDDERLTVGGSASASDWAPASADSESESGDSGMAGEPPADKQRKGPVAKAAAASAAGHKSSKSSKGSKGSMAGATVGMARRKPAGLGAAAGSKRKRAEDDESADVAAAVALAAGRAEDAVPVAGADPAGQTGSKPKTAGGARKAGKGHASSLPVMLPKALAQARGTAEASHLLCELELPKDSAGRPLAGMAHAVSLEGDSGPVGRVLVPKSSQFQLDLKGILYETEAVPLPCTLALVHTKNAGSELVVQQLFSSVLRCEPGQDFMRENEGALREMEAYDSDRYGGGSEGEDGGGRRAKGGRGGKGGRAKPAGGRGRGGRKPAGGRGKGAGAGKKVAAPRKRAAPKPKAAGGGAAAGGGKKPAAKKARGSKAAAKAEASSGSDWDSDR